MNIAVIGDSDMIVGFRLAGIKSVFEASPKNAESVFEKVSSESFDVIIMTEDLAAFLKGRVEEFQEEVTPIIIEVPGKKGPTGYARDAVRELIKRAVGVDISVKKEG